jgi:uncharacterized protein YecE (DUF72 family)
LYGAQRLAPIAERLTSELARGHDVYCYFNNDYEGFAVTDAQTLRSAIS